MAEKTGKNKKKEKEKSMIKVELLPGNTVSPAESASFSAKSCYMSKFPVWGVLIDFFGSLFKSGHHTTFEHAASYFSFKIDGYSVGDITFGLHLSSPFYNTSQRSGRYCASMFVKFVKKIREILQGYLMKLFPNYAPELDNTPIEQFDPEEKLKEIKNYIQEFWPVLGDEQVEFAMDYVHFGIDVFQNNIEPATLKAADFAKAERPFAKPDWIQSNAPKIAQEQLRNFIPVITPTGLVFTVDLIALIALYESAWTPAMKQVTGQMADLVMKKFPDLAKMFNPENRRKDCWGAKIEGKSTCIYAPKVEVLGIDGAEDFVLPEAEDRHPVDKLRYKPELMDNSVSDIKSKISISVATMGQDQRHRTLKRGTPKFTGEFYMPPILADLNLEKEAVQLLEKWRSVAETVPDDLAMVLAPYGAVVTYVKKGDFLAVDHEQGKRTCWCAQQEIYWAGVLLREEIGKMFGFDHELLEIFEPPCCKTGKCGEVSRFCGRDISVRNSGDYFPERKV